MSPAAAVPEPVDFPAEPWKATAIPPEVADGPLAFTCPRCRLDVEEVGYGPCSSCREELRSLGGEKKELVQEDYIPKMNVTPNAVALKE